MSKARNSKPKAQNYKKILVVRLDRMGDVALSTPALKALRGAYPDSRISFMVRPYVKDIAEGNPYINEVIICDKSGPFGGISGVVNIIRKIRAGSFDLAVILHPTVRAHWIVYLSGIPKRLGFNRKMGVLLTDRIPDKKHLGLKHEIDYTLGLLEHIGVKPVDRKMYIPVNRASEDKVSRIIAENGIKENESVVTVNPGASCPSKRWPVERFAEAADRLVKKFGVRVIVISGPDDALIGHKTASLMKEPRVDLSSRTTVADVASLLRRSKLFISNDSGPVHVACAVGTPVIAIFGRRDRGLSPRRWGPSNKTDVALHKDPGCVECLAHNCVIGFKCLDMVTVEEVVKTAEVMLK